MGDVININPARGNVGGNKDRCFTFPEALKRPCALILTFIAMNGACRQVILCQHARNFIRAMLGSGKHNDARESCFLKNIDEQLRLGMFGNIDHALVNAFNGLGFRVDGHFLGRIEKIIGKAADLFWHRRREQRCAPVTRQSFHDAANGRQKAHIQHLVGFIEDNRCCLVDPDGACSHMVEQAARCRDKNVNAARHGTDLLVRFYPAHHDSGLVVDEFCISCDVLADLSGKFACGCHDQCAAAARFGAAFIGGDFIE